ncbi:hypothetical protein CC78DRAFT_528906 [Lojkania enalia]|uniref:Uncharacterized protein n=1 Tax=Lojkania enalia TaxID=147567 RepID=A0A9P4NAN8_9PLEO|nr:hypothetical protein CC78DRAFT_528906 [Didymosphaeria enalia]
MNQRRQQPQNERAVAGSASPQRYLVLFKKPLSSTRRGCQGTLRSRREQSRHARKQAMKQVVR